MDNENVLYIHSGTLFSVRKNEVGTRCNDISVPQEDASVMRGEKSHLSITRDLLFLPLLHPLYLAMVLFAFLVSAVTQVYVLTPEDLELRITEQRSSETVPRKREGSSGSDLTNHSTATTQILDQWNNGNRLAGLQAAEDFPITMAHLPVGLLEFQMCYHIWIYMDSKDLSQLQRDKESIMAVMAGNGSLRNRSRKLDVHTRVASTEKRGGELAV
ncbi:hypothetical protein STEG23_018689, partial [Scotinomys teguina]